MRACGFVLCIVGVILLGVFSILGFGGMDMIFTFAITMMMRLKEGTDIWKIWTTIPIPIYLKFRFFNITNPEAVANGAKAFLVEMGPYVYLEDLEKVDITIHEENDTIHYRQTKTYYFQPEMSNGQETDVVTFINIIYLSVAAIAHEFTEEEFMLNSLDGMLKEKGERLCRTATVRELIFDGVNIQTYIDMFNDDLVQAAAEASGNPLVIPENIADGKFALLKGKNGSDDGWYDAMSAITTGPMDLGRILMYQNKPHLSYWKGSPEDGCNQINGTDSTIFPPFMTKESRVQVFSSQVCRSLTFVFDEEGVSKGIHVYRFQLAPDSFLSPLKQPANWCFCPTLKNETSSCERNGILDIRPCFGGAPIIVSSPHFLGADDWILKGVEGLNPDPNKHKMVINFHPFTGSPVEAFARIQFNIELIPYYAMASFEDAQNAIIPFAWVEEHAILDDFNLNMLAATDAFKWGFGYARFGLIGVGALLFVIGSVLAIFGGKKSKGDVPENLEKPSTFVPTYD